MESLPVINQEFTRTAAYHIGDSKLSTLCGAFMPQTGDPAGQGHCFRFFSSIALLYKGRYHSLNHRRGQGID